MTHDKIQALFEVKMESKEELAKKMINSKAKPTYCTVDSTTLKIYVVRKRCVKTGLTEMLDPTSFVVTFMMNSC